VEALLFLLDIAVVSYLMWRVHKAERTPQGQAAELGLLAPKQGEEA
jgi:hypothetical protein